MVATEEVAHAQKKSVPNSSVAGGGWGTFKASGEIYAAVF